MDPITLAAAGVAAFLASLGGAAGQGTWAGIESLVTSVRRRLSGDPALDTAERRPDDPVAVDALAGRLEAYARRDAGFARELAELRTGIERAPGSGQQVTTINHGTIGKQVTIGNAGDVTF